MRKMTELSKRYCWLVIRCVVGITISVGVLLGPSPTMAQDYCAAAKLKAAAKDASCRFSQLAKGAKSGFSRSLPAEKCDRKLDKAASKAARVCTCPGQVSEQDCIDALWSEISLTAIDSLAFNMTIADWTTADGSNGLLPPNVLAMAAKYAIGTIGCVGFGHTSMSQPASQSMKDCCEDSGCIVTEKQEYMRVGGQTTLCRVEYCDCGAGDGRGLDSYFNPDDWDDAAFMEDCL